MPCQGSAQHSNNKLRAWQVELGTLCTFMHQGINPCLDKAGHTLHAVAPLAARVVLERGTATLQVHAVTHQRWIVTRRYL